MKHLDLFSGIGGFAYAIDQVYGAGVEHTFVEWEKFPQAVLRKHWKDAEIHGDIREFIANAKRGRPHHEENEQELESERSNQLGAKQPRNTGIYFLTGGFPCQPFSQAGRRKGTQDDRYLWPEMLECIALFRPKWVIAENVAGLVTWNEGLVLETVCTDLEKEGYEVQPFVIPACAIGAPHRRDRVWIVANRKHERPVQREPQKRPRHKKGLSSGNNSNAPDTTGQGLEGGTGESIQGSSERFTSRGNDAQDTISRRTRRRNDTTKRPAMGNKRGEIQATRPDWTRNWQEVALATCHDRVDDGLPRRMDGVTISGARHRRERLIACGNAIVPQVAVEILKAIKETDALHKERA